MRNTFFALVLANLAFAAWHYGFYEPAQPLQRGRGVPTIFLATELDTGSAPATLARAESAEPVAADSSPPPTDSEPGVVPEAGDDASAQAEVASEAASSGEAQPLAADTAALPALERCVSVGPFRELSQAAEAAAILRERGYLPSQRAGEGDIWVGYWVYLEGIPTVADANGIVTTLRENGITDSYVIPNSDSGNLVSLGVFTEIARAGGRRESARALGFEPVIVDRTRPGTVYWVDVNLQDQESLDFDLLQSPGRIVRLEQRACVD